MRAIRVILACLLLADAIGRRTIRPQVSVPGLFTRLPCQAAHDDCVFDSRNNSAGNVAHCTTITGRLIVNLSADHVMVRSGFA
jgi:hypothetical protein